MKKRVLSIALTAVMGISLLSGCSASSTKTSPTEASSSANSSAAETETESSEAGGKFDPASAGKVTLRFAWWGSDARHEATLAAIDHYMELYPNVTIEGEYQGYDGYQQKLMTQFAGGTEPDLMQLDYVWNPEWEGQETMFVDMANNDLVDLSGFQKKALSDYMTVNGRVIGLPMNTSGFGTMINKSFFDKHGLDAKTVWTWEDMIEVGKKIHNEAPDDYLFAIESGTTTGGISPFILSAYIYSKTGHYWATDDGAKVQATEDELTQAFDILQQLFASGTAQPLGEASLFTGQMEQNPKWLNGQIGFTVDWTATVDKYKSSLPDGSFAVGQPPFAKDGDNQNIQLTSAMGLGVSARSKNAEVATHFANWLMTDPEAALLLGTKRSVPNNSIALKALEEDGQVSKEISQMLEWATAAPAARTPMIQTNSEVADIIKDICEQVVYGKMTPQEAAQKFLTDVQAKLDSLHS
ncbi:Putative ABC transporter substrate-binding protein YesO [Clostridium sp. C105KSO15]|nr:Putative ABC transporter substrate-binding protein YesO [Clostridium sp. C105KSO15]